MATKSKSVRGSKQKVAAKKRTPPRSSGKAALATLPAPAEVVEAPKVEAAPSGAVFGFLPEDTPS